MREFILKAPEIYADTIKEHNLQELIRCKDCTHETDHDCPISWGKTGDDFCSFAERKDEC